MKIIKALLLIFVTWLAFMLGCYVSIFIILLPGVIFFTPNTPAVYPNVPLFLKYIICWVLLILGLSIFIFLPVFSFIKIKRFLFKPN